MSKKNIIITIDWFLPGTNAGGPVRSIKNLIDQLSDFTFYIITSDTDYCATKPYDTIQSNKWLQHTENTFVYYFSEDQLSKENLRRVIIDIDSQTIFINGIYSKFFSRIPLELSIDHKLKTIVSARGMLSPHALAVKPLKKKLFLRFQNAQKKYRDVHFHVTNKEEKDYVTKVIGKFKDIYVIPNLPRKSNSANSLAIEKEEGVIKLISLGRIAEEKGTLVSLEALRNVKGNVELHLYGTIYNEQYWSKCKAIINDLPDNIKVSYKDSLDAELIMDTYKRYHFLLLPSKGENYGHSIVESFQAGRPVIISKHTPWKELEKEMTGFDVKESELSTAIQKAIDMDQSEYNHWSKSAHQKGKQIANDPTVIEKYKQLFRSDL